MNAARSREARRTEGPSTRPPPLSTPAGEAQGWSRSPFPAQVLTSHVTSGGGSAHHARSRPSGCWASLFLTNGSGGDGCRRSPRACAQIRGAALFSSSELRASGGTGTTRSARQPGGGRPRALGPKSAESRPRTLSAAGPQAQTQAPRPGGDDRGPAPPTAGKSATRPNALQGTQRAPGSPRRAASPSTPRSPGEPPGTPSAAGPWQRPSLTHAPVRPVKLTSGQGSACWANPPPWLLLRGCTTPGRPGRPPAPCVLAPAPPSKHRPPPLPAASARARLPHRPLSR